MPLLSNKSIAGSGAATDQVLVWPQLDHQIQLFSYQLLLNGGFSRSLASLAVRMDLASSPASPRGMCPLPLPAPG